MKNLTKILCALMVVFMISCAKDGAVGPAGVNGNANVIYSDWAKSENSIRDTSIDGSSLNTTHLVADSLTLTNINSATILVFTSFLDGLALPLPYTSYAGGKANTISFFSKVGKIFITRFAHDNSNSVKLSSSLVYRYIIIPGSTHLRLAKPLNQMTYDEVCELYNIPK